MALPSLKSIAEILVARHRSEDWFVKATYEPGRAVLWVKTGSPVRTHRPVLGCEVVVREMKFSPVRLPSTPPRKKRAGDRTELVRSPRRLRRPRSPMAAAQALQQIVGDRALTRLAREVRSEMLGERHQVPLPPDGMGFVVSQALAGRVARLTNVVPEIEQVNLGFTKHWLLRLKSGRVLDATADQFNHLLPASSPLPAVYLGEMPRAYVEWAREKLAL